ncbi:MAG: RNA-dependent RNA polymerase [Fushun monolepta lauta xinmovirus 2]|uniref:RNA-directed RNA polymerase n=1 Tax=Fushun monolepta lauta xinmovirus 2 TaxID=2905555 RepID=A0A8K1XFM0_9MONO|nr:MAG: RNA-dependent RNA polymerase [Fushun monolepta lauta xinmovirus 2]
MEDIGLEYSRPGSFDSFELNDMFEEVNTRGPSKWRIPGHLREPIIPDECIFLLTYREKQFFCKRHRRMQEVLNTSGINSFIYDKCRSPWECLDNYIRSLPTKSCYEEDLAVAVRSGINNYLIQKTSYINAKNYFEDSTLRDKLESIILSDERILLAYVNKRKSEVIKDKICEREFEIGSVLTESNSLLCEKEIFFFKCEKHGKSIGPTALLLGALDIHQTRFSLLVYWKLCDFFDKYQGSSIYRLGTALIDQIDGMRSILGEDLFKVMKAWEPLVIGDICRKESDTGFADLYTTTVDGIREFIHIPEVQEFKRLIAINSGKERDKIKMQLELIALNKGFGHPCIDNIEGLREIRKLAGKKTEINPNIAKRVRCVFVRNFIKAFIEKNRKWPEVTFTQPPRKEILSARNNDRWLRPLEASGIDLSEWDLVRFAKNFEFDCSPDTSELISDKSCSPRLSHWTQKYDRCGFKHLHHQEKPKQEPDTTRVILRYLVGEEGETEEVVNEVDSGSPDSENNICILCRKERELKKKGRLFCEQTYRQRLLQTACEQNINKYIFPYIKTQTMSDTELSLRKKINYILKCMRKGSAEVFNLDLYRWNMLQRHESNYFISRDLDDLFGKRHLYKDSHLWMQRSYVLSNSRVNPPRINEINGLPLPGPSCHRGQYGGFEGMRQKLWTISTLCILALASEEERVPVQILGQGDNVVILAKWGRDHRKDIDRNRANLLARIDNYISGLGLKLKLEETWMSNRLFAYGRTYYLYGTAVSNGTKRGMRIISDENDGIPTIETSISMISTATENIALNDWIPDMAFLTYSIEAISYFFRKKILTNPIDLNIATSTLLWPSIFGGLPVSTLANHSIRGMDDSLTIWVSIYRIIRVINKQLFNVILRTVRFSEKSDKDYQGLIQDIYSLNITRIQTASLAAREIVRESLNRFATNPEITKILNIDVSEKEELIELLISIRPLFLPLSHELLKNSNIGMVYNLQNKLTNVQTIVKISSNRGERPFDVITFKNKAVVTYLQAIYSNFPNIDSLIKTRQVNNFLNNRIQCNTCSAEIAQSMRDDTWGVEVKGVTQPVPWEQLEIKDLDKISKRDEDNYLSIVLSDELLRDPVVYRNHQGPFEPYMGSVTHVKSGSIKLNLINPGPFLKSLRELFYLKAWATKECSEDLIQLIDYLVAEKKNILKNKELLENLDLDQESVYGGNIYHRFRSTMQSRGALLNSLSGIGSHVKLSTTSMKRYCRGGEDRTIFFQCCFLYIMSYLASNSLVDPESIFSKQLGARFPCTYCCRVVDGSEFHIVPTSCKLTKLNTTGPLESVTTIDPNRITDMSLALSFAIAKALSDKIRFHILQMADEASVSTLTIEEGARDINVNELRAVELHHFIAALFFCSNSLRYDLLDESPTPGKMLSPGFKLLHSLLITSGRLDEFCKLYHVRPTKFSEGVSPTLGGQMIHRGMKRSLRMGEVVDLIEGYCTRFLNSELIPFSNIGATKGLMKVLFWRHKETLSKLIEENYLYICIYRDELNKLFNSVKDPDNLTKDEKLNISITRKHRDKHRIRMLELESEIRRGSILLTKGIRSFTMIRNTYLHLKQYISQVQGGKSLRPFKVIELITSDDARTRWRKSLCPRLHIELKHQRSTMEADPPCMSPTDPQEFKSVFTFVDAKSSSLFSRSDWYSLDIGVEYSMYRHCSLVLGNTNTSPSVLLHLLVSHSDFLRSNPVEEDKELVVIGFADGTCELSNLCTHLYGTKIVCNTLMTPDNVQAFEYTDFIPPGFLGEECFNPYDTILYRKQSFEGETDITQRVFSRKIIKKLLENNQHIALFLVDIDTLEEATLSLLYERLWDYQDVRSSNSIIIVKTLLSYKLMLQIKEIWKGFNIWLYSPSSYYQGTNRCYCIIGGRRDATLHGCPPLKTTMPVLKGYLTELDHVISEYADYIIANPEVNATILCFNVKHRPYPTSGLCWPDLGKLFYTYTQSGQAIMNLALSRGVRCFSGIYNRSLESFSCDFILKEINYTLALGLSPINYGEMAHIQSAANTLDSIISDKYNELFAILIVKRIIMNPSDEATITRIRTYLMERFLVVDKILSKEGRRVFYFSRMGVTFHNNFYMKNRDVLKRGFCLAGDSGRLCLGLDCYHIGKEMITTQLDLNGGRANEVQEEYQRLIKLCYSI